MFADPVRKLGPVDKAAYCFCVLKHLLALADELRERGVGLVVLRQQIDTTTPAGRLAFQGYSQDKHETRSGPASPCVEALARPGRRVWPPGGLPVL